MCGLSRWVYLCFWYGLLNGDVLGSFVGVGFLGLYCLEGFVTVFWVNREYSLVCLISWVIDKNCCEGSLVCSRGWRNGFDGVESVLRGHGRKGLQDGDRCWGWSVWCTWGIMSRNGFWEIFVVLLDMYNKSVFCIVCWFGVRWVFCLLVVECLGRRDWRTRAASLLPWEGRRVRILCFG